MELPIRTRERAVISEDSPFRRLPAALVPEQKMFFNGIRFSVEVLSSAMTALRPSLRDITELRDIPDGDRGDLYPPAMMLAWSAVDSANRFRVLVESMRRRGWVQGGPLFKARLRALDRARPIRDSVQHLNERIGTAMEQGEQAPVWGTLNWFVLTDFDADGEPAGGESCVLAPGAVVTTILPALNPMGREMRNLVDPIELHAFGKSVSLSTLEWTVDSLIDEWEEILREQFAGLTETVGSDLFLRLTFRSSVDEPS